MLSDCRLYNFPISRKRDSFVYLFKRNNWNSMVFLETSRFTWGDVTYIYVSASMYGSRPGRVVGSKVQGFTWRQRAYIRKNLCISCKRFTYIPGWKLLEHLLKFHVSRKKMVDLLRDLKYVLNGKEFISETKNLRIFGKS